MPAPKCCCRIPLHVIEGDQRIALNVERVRVVYADMPEYEGEYTVTPTQQTQVLQTHGKRMTRDVTINPIPSNYGLITWNGATLTVS